jgi:hypothetical protein
MMAAWFALAAPYLPEIIRLARPLFTRTKAQDKAPEVMTEQILELQNAVTQNAASVKVLAQEMQKTIDAIQQGAEILERKLDQARRLALVAVVFALLALGLVVYIAI